MSSPILSLDTSLLVDAALKSFVLLALTALTVGMMRRASAAAKHLVWFLGILGVLVLAPISTVVPGWHIFLSWPATPVAAVRPDDSNQQVAHEPASPSSIPSEAIDAKADSPQARPSAPAATPAVPAPRQIEPSRQRFTWQTLAVQAWLAVMVLILGYVLLGLISLWRLGRQSLPIAEGAWQALVNQLCGQLGIRGKVELLASDRRTMPMTWGLRRTRLLLPADARGWPPELARAVLLHELAHVKRRDCLTQMVAHLACALFWFNPLVWLARQRMQSEREQACDDLVLASGVSAPTYAKQLLHVAAGMSLPRLSAAAIAMARPSKLKDRLTAILDPSRSRQLAARTTVWFWLVAGVCIAVFAAVHVEDLSGDSALAVVGRWAAGRGWRAQEVTSTRLESSFLPGWRNLPFHLSNQEEADARACIELARKARTSNNGKTLFADPSTREALEEILNQRPDYFYAEFLLSMWHRDYGDPDESQRLLDAAYEHAPVILVQRFEFADGSPLVGGTIYDSKIECNRVEQGQLDQINLEFLNLRTDASGCICLPVYNTVYRWSSASSPYGYSVSYPTLGWFETSRKVALLPVAVVKAKAGSFVPAVSTSAPPTSRTDLADGNSVELVAISRGEGDRQSGWWLPDGRPSPREYEATNPDPDGWQAGPKWRLVVRFAKPLSQDAQMQLRSSAPSGNARFGSVRGEDPRTTFAVFNSFPTQPATISLRLGVASGEGKTLGQYDPHTRTTTGELPTGFVFSDVKEIGDAGTVNYRAQIAVEHPTVEEQLRFYALDVDHHEHTPGSWSQRTGYPLATGRVEDGAEFWRLPLEKIASFRLEARDYQWAEFDNIPLEPAGSDGRPTTTGLLPDGNTIELVAISNLLTEPVRQWLPDGSPSPRAYKTIDPKSSPAPHVDKLRQFIFRFGGAPPTDVNFEFQFSADTGTNRLFIGLAGQPGEILGAVITEFPTSPKNVAIRVGESFGSWNTLAELDPSSRAVTGQLPAGFTFTDVRQVGPRVEVLLDYSQKNDRELRLTAIDHKGGEHKMTAQMIRLSPGSSLPMGSTFRFEPLELESIASLRLEYRPIGWVDFDAIPLNPRP
jgi:beta-lactamase regulating signal transducer with metallopeptidase domain